MKKIVLSIAGVMAAAAFAPEASALPAFARQTGMACTACHAQHFPVLNGFGRAFKAAGYTMMGAQEKVEGEHLSIPDTLNAAVLLKAQYVKSNLAGVAGGGKTAAANTGNGQWLIPNEFSLFLGGRAAENVGFFMENNLAATSAAPLIASARIPMIFDMGGAKVGATVFTTDANGVSFGYELSSGGIFRPNRWAEHRRETSAVQAVGFATAATGIALSAQNDMGYVAYSMWSPTFAAGGGTSHFGSNYLRIVATPNVGDWNLHVGGGFVNGNTYDNVTLAQQQTRMQFFDLQAQGEVGGKELSVYAQQASVPLTAVGAPVNAFGSNKSAWTIGADYSVIPHALSLGLGYRNFNTNRATGAKDNAWTATAVYDLYQNVALVANYSSYSGLAKSNGGSLTTLMLEAAW